MRILLAVSGGIDSMYLANRAPELFPGASFAVAHCNFGLRGAESDGDEAFVRQWCADAGLEIFVRRFATAEYASGKGISIEMAARELRYEWFAQLCGEHGFDGVAVAHNANDNAETLILNILRGTGSRGMRGMAASRDGILRPLLDTPRAEIEKWMRENGKSWREDSTNTDSAYKRNRIRGEVFPLFEKINPSFLKTLGRDMEHLALVDDIADSYYKSVRPSLGDPLEVDALLALEHWEYVLWRAVEPCGLSEETFGKLRDLLSKFRSSPRGTVTVSGKTFESPTCTITIRKGRLEFYSVTR